MVKPFSVIEWHCNITEYNYDNYDHHHLHLHSHNELLHNNFVDSNFYGTQGYKETSNKN